jgi:hypothetical protein
MGFARQSKGIASVGRRLGSRVQVGSGRRGKAK